MRGQVILRHIHTAHGNRALYGAMGVALEFGVNVMLTCLPISHLRHFRPSVSFFIAFGQRACTTFYFPP